jgi:hypothetical protein
MYCTQCTRTFRPYCIFLLHCCVLLCLKDLCSETEFLEVIGKKVLRVFLLAIHSQLFYRLLIPPRKKIWIWFYVNIVYGNFKSENSQDYAQIMPETSTKLCVHEFDFSICCTKKATLKADFLAILGTGFLDTSLQNIWRCFLGQVTCQPLTCVWPHSKQQMAREGKYQLQITIYRHCIHPPF